jgi:hypothetical protein
VTFELIYWKLESANLAYLLFSVHEEFYTAVVFVCRSATSRKETHSKMKKRRYRCELSWGLFDDPSCDEDCDL